MGTITVTLPEEDAARLRDLADRLGVSAQDLVRVGVDDILGGRDEEFELAVQRVRGRNAELYRRLG